MRTRASKIPACAPANLYDAQVDGLTHSFMGRVMAETNIKQCFTEHDLRTKAGSDGESLAKGQALLQHADAAARL